MKKHLLLFITCCMIQTCSIKAPELSVTGERTALMNQVIGTFQQIEADTWVITSNPTYSKYNTAEERADVIQAVKGRQFNQDEINDLKRDKVVGENNRGFLEVRPTERYRTQEQYRDLVDELVNEENQDRRIVYEQVLAMNQVAEEKSEQDSYRIFARLNIEKSEPGTWIQLANGEWVEKQEQD
jgi:uncharacterized protein YdbL (DUF1318 family)